MPIKAIWWRARRQHYLAVARTERTAAGRRECFIEACYAHCKLMALLYQDRA